MFNNLRNLFDRMFWAFAAVMFVLAFAAVTVSYAWAQASAYAGELTLTWEDYTNGMSELFKDFGSLVLVLVALAVFFAAVWLAGWFARTGRIRWNQAWYIIGLIVGGVLLSQVKPDSFGFGWAPVIALVGFALIMAAILRLIARVLAPAPQPEPAPVEAPDAAPAA